MDKILVTGGLGFIGSNFIRRILYLRRNVTVINLDNMSAEANPENLRDLEKDQRYHFIKGDIADIKLISKIVKKVDTIVNFAAETHVDRSIAEPQPFVDTNIIGTYRILEAARKNNPEVRMLHVSTDEIYGDIESGSFEENDGLKPSNPYSATKAAADMLALAYYRTYGLNLSVTRCTNNFGPYQHPEKLIPKAIIRAIRNLAVPVYGKGNQVRDWIYVQDHCDALLQTLEKGKAGEIYNISAGNGLPNLKIVELILNIMKKPVNLIEFVDDRPGHDIRYSLDSTKIQSQTGWSPKHNLTEALKNTVNWYMNNNRWWKPLATTKTLHPTPWKLKW